MLGLGSGGHWGSSAQSKRHTSVLPLLSQGAPQSWLSLQPVPLCPPWGLSSTYLSEVSFRRIRPSEVTKDIRNSGLGMKHSS